jgi:hypothetical protein
MFGAAKKLFGSRGNKDQVSDDVKKLNEAPKQPQPQQNTAKPTPPSTTKQPEPTRNVNPKPSVPGNTSNKKPIAVAPTQPSKVDAKKPTVVEQKPKPVESKADVPTGGFLLYQKLEQEARQKEQSKPSTPPPPQEISQEEQERIKKEKQRKKEDKRQKERELIEKITSNPAPDQEVHDLMYKIPQSSAQILKAICSNIVRAPSEQKFKQLKLSNPKINENITQYPQAIKILQILGFSVSEDVAVMSDQNVNVELLQKVVLHCDNRLGLNPVIGESAVKKKREAEQLKLKEEIRKQMELDRKLRD